MQELDIVRAYHMAGKLEEMAVMAEKTWTNVGGRPLPFAKMICGVLLSVALAIRLEAERNER